MRFFDHDKIGCYLDAIRHRVEKGTAGNPDRKLVDLRLRVQPFTPDLAALMHRDVKSLLFTKDGAERRLVKAIDFDLPVPDQQLQIFSVPDTDHVALALDAAAISKIRARAQKDVDGFALLFTVTVYPVLGAELEYLKRWHTEQAFVTFEAQQPDLLDAPAATSASATH
jgi:hypothetical protein